MTPDLFSTPLQWFHGAGTKPRARTTDPGTSHAAAASITEYKLRDSQGRVLVALARHGPCSDYELWSHIADTGADPPPMSESGMRTRRSELVDLGLVEDSGQKHTLPSGRMAIRWRCVLGSR